jgi:hypothetical protein
MMGSSGLEHRPETGGVLRYYHLCNKKPDAFVKTIANTWFLANHAGNVHNFEYRCVSLPNRVRAPNCLIVTDLFYVVLSSLQDLQIALDERQIFVLQTGKPFHERMKLTYFRGNTVFRVPQ